MAAPPLPSWAKVVTPAPSAGPVASKPLPSWAKVVKAAPTPSKVETSPGASFVHGLGNTFGTGDIIGAGIQADLKGITNIPALVRGELSPMDNLRSIWDEYQTARGQNRTLAEAHQKEHPGAGIAGRLLGSVMTGPISGVGTGIKAAAGYNAAQGALEAGVNSDAQDFGDRLNEAAVGGLVGGTLGALGHKIGSAIGRRLPGAAESARDSLEDLGAEQALKAAGAKKKDLTAIALRDPERIREMGRTLLDEPDVIPAFASVEKVGRNVEDAKDLVNTLRLDALKDADAAGVPFDMGRFLARAEEEIIHPNIDDPAVAGEINAIRGLLDGYFEGMGGGPISFARANQLKSNLQQGQINWGNHWNNAGPSKFLEQFKMKLQGIFHDEIDNQIGEAAGGATKDAFQAAKKRLGPLISAAKWAREGDAREVGNDFLGIKDMQAAQTGLMAAAQSGQSSLGGLATAAAVGLANKFATGRGSSAVARGADRLATSEWLEELVKTNPETLGEYGGILADALTRGPAAMAARDWVLSSTDPAYRQRKQAAQNAAQGSR